MKRVALWLQESPKRVAQSEFRGGVFVVICVEQLSDGSGSEKARGVDALLANAFEAAGKKL